MGWQEEVVSNMLTSASSVSLGNLLASASSVSLNQLLMSDMNPTLSRNVSNTSLADMVRNYSSASLEAVMEHPSLLDQAEPWMPHPSAPVGSKKGALASKVLAV